MNLRPAKTQLKLMKISLGQGKWKKPDSPVNKHRQNAQVDYTNLAEPLQGQLESDTRSPKIAMSCASAMFKLMLEGRHFEVRLKARPVGVRQKDM